MGLAESLVLGACARVDRFVLDHFIRRRPCEAPAGLRERLERARRFYADPRFVEDAGTFFETPTPLRAGAPRRVLALPDGELQIVGYETDFRPVFPDAQNDALDAATAPGAVLWWRHARPGHTAMLCVHGYGGGQVWLESLAFEALGFYRAGMDVAIYVLPYHGARCPESARHSGEAFFDMDLVRTNEAFARAVYELRALVRHLRASGTGPVGAFGMSLGAYTTALLATVEAELAFAVAMIPIVSFADRWWGEGADGDPWLAVACANGWSEDGVRELLRVHEPTVRPPVVPRDRLLVIGALGDAICTPEHATRLWEHWGGPRMHWYRGGHLVQLGRRAALGAVRKLVRDAGLPLRPADDVARAPAAARPAPASRPGTPRTRRGNTRRDAGVVPSVRAARLRKAPRRVARRVR